MVGLKLWVACGGAAVAVVATSACSSESSDPSRVVSDASADRGSGAMGGVGGLVVDDGAAGGGSGGTGGVSGSGGNAPGSGGSGGSTSSRCEQEGPCQATRCTDPFARECSWSCLPFFVCDEIFVRFDAASPDSLDGPYTLTTPDAARCVLEALRDGTGGSFVLYVNTDQPVVLRREVLIFSNRNVLTQETATTNGVDVDALVGPYPLHPPSYFENCLTLTDPNQLYTCFTDLGASCEN